MALARPKLTICAALLVGALGCSSDDEDVPDAAAAADADVSEPGPPTIAACFANDRSSSEPFGPGYEQYAPVVGSHCMGTNHQAIEGVERLVFLGDSVTVGTPPTPVQDHYRSLLGARVKERFGDIPVDNCARNGARTDDFLLGDGAEILECFSEDENAGTTLVVWTMGGNDISNWAGDALPSDDALVAADAAADLLEDAVAWLKAPGRFPDGVFIIYANPYEFTDATGDLESCAAAAAFVGDTGNWIEGEAAVLRFQERHMQVAVEHGVDMIFALERFCGHGYRRDDPEGRCYLGPDAELWFDLTCTHPNSAGHAELANMFMAVIEE